MTIYYGALIGFFSLLNVPLVNPSAYDNTPAFAGVLLLDL